MTAMAFLVVFCLSFAVSMLLVPVSMWLARLTGAVDRPGGRRMGHDVTPRLGGVAIFGGFAAAAIAAQWLPVPRFDPYEIIRFIGLMGGATFIFAAGLLDDLFDLHPVGQWVAHIGAAGIAVAFLIFIQSVNNPFTGSQFSWIGAHWFTVAVSIFWLVLMINTVNFLDGLDGLAGGVSLIAGVLLFINSAFRLIPAQTSVSLLPLALVGACLGFLVYNFNPAKVFMGSSGSYFLGYALGALSIIGGAKMATILLVMGLPLLDVAWQVVNRLSLGKNPLEGDRGHLHFRLVDMGISVRQIVLAYYTFSLFFGGVALVTNSRLFKLIALIVMCVIAITGFALLKRIESRMQVAEA
ncbi:MAG: MraY family glycosyltransferase [Chloroflexota bacterium]